MDETKRTPAVSNWNGRNQKSISGGFPIKPKERTQAVAVRPLAPRNTSAESCVDATSVPRPSNVSAYPDTYPACGCRTAEARAACCRKAKDRMSQEGDGMRSLGCGRGCRSHAMQGVARKKWYVDI
eukprot:3375007-Prymnesium_polylepis.4